MLCTHNPQPCTIASHTPQTTTLNLKSNSSLPIHSPIHVAIFPCLTPPMLQCTASCCPCLYTQSHSTQTNNTYMVNLSYIVYTCVCKTVYPCPTLTQCPTLHVNPQTVLHSQSSWSRLTSTATLHVPQCNWGWDGRAACTACNRPVGFW